MTAIEIYKGEFTNGQGEGVSEVLMRLTPVPVPKPHETHRPSSAMMSALAAVSQGSPHMQEVIPDPDGHTEVRVALDSATVADLAYAIEQAAAMSRSV